MHTPVNKLAIGLVLLATSFSACQKKNCPTFWSAPDGAPADISTNATEKDSGENLSNTDGQTKEFPLVRVKRDKNGIVVKKQVVKPKKKNPDPRKNYKPQS